MGQAAFVLRVEREGKDKVPPVPQFDSLFVGWAKAEGLLDPGLTWEAFREVVRKSYYADETTLRKAGQAAGHLWRFIREMKLGDLIVVPHGPEFYVAEVSGHATYDHSKVGDDSAYRRTVQWLNSGKPIPRRLARSALISRMKTQGTSVDATDLLDQINECLGYAGRTQMPTFHTDLRARLIRETLAELHDGRIDSFGFEELIQTVLMSLGAKEVRIVPRKDDKGADLLATFLVAGTFQLVVAVQAKHWQPKPPVSSDVVEQLIRGIEAESANLGMIVTSGSISDNAAEAAERYFKEKGIRIELVDGEQFAGMMIEHGVCVSS